MLDDMTPDEAATVASRIASTGSFIAARCPSCFAAKRPYRDVSADDGKACYMCVAAQNACPGCGKGNYPIVGNWHDCSGKWHRECAIKAGRMSESDGVRPMMLRREPPHA